MTVPDVGGGDISSRPVHDGQLHGHGTPRRMLRISGSGIRGGCRTCPVQWIDDMTSTVQEWALILRLVDWVNWSWKDSTAHCGTWPNNVNSSVGSMRQMLRDDKRYYHCIFVDSIYMKKTSRGQFS